MISREEFERIVDAFMGELSAIVVTESTSKLRRYPDFARQLSEVTNDVSSGTVDTDHLLTTAFGLVDGYVEAAQNEILDAAYEFYCDQAGHDAST